MIRLKLLLAVGVFVLPGCATTSFAPPSVSLPANMAAGSLGAHCAFVSSNSVGKNVEGALQLTINFISSYSCARDQAANGRQVFQIPSFIALVGAATAAAFGAPPDVAIAAGAANQVFTAGNNYYAPAEQAQILRDAVDAFNCINSEAVGIPAMARLQRSSTPSATDGQRLVEGAAVVRITPERIYFNMVTSRLLAVHNVAAQRLSRRGTFGAAGIAAQIEQLAKKIHDQQEAADRANETSRQAAAEAARVTNAEMLASESRRAGFSQAAARARQAAAAAEIDAVELDLSVLQPKLDLCVLRAQA